MDYLFKPHQPNGATLEDPSATRESPVVCILWSAGVIFPFPAKMIRPVNIRHTTGLAIAKSSAAL